jgi:hypothetical protein
MIRGPLLAALWGFAEGTFFFVVPDVLFTRTTLVSAKRGWLQFAAAIIGATMAGLVIYLWASHSPAQARSNTGLRIHLAFWIVVYAIYWSMNYS